MSEIDQKALEAALQKYDEAVEWHSYRPHDVNREAAQHRAAAGLANAIRPILSALPPSPAQAGMAVPDGWRLVPAEPTQAMFANLTASWPKDDISKIMTGKWALGSFVEDYKAMLSASPLHPAPSRQEVVEEPKTYLSMWAEVVVNDDGEPVWRCNEASNRDGEHDLQVIELAANTFPPGARIEITEAVDS